MESSIPNKDDSEFLDSAKKINKDQKKTTIQWPSFKENAISEYGDKKIFCMAFPWLYPGGNGDFVESCEKSRL